MKKFTFLFTVLMLWYTASFATKIIVDINGGGQYTSISAGITAAVTNDTVIVWPGTYNEAVNLNKNIALQGSGYENTKIVGTFNPIVTISSGVMKWFYITSLNGVGVKMSGGTITNCCVIGCSNNGIYNNTSSASCNVINCTILNNGSNGVLVNGGGIGYIVNCISRNNGDVGFNGYGSTLWRSYSNGSQYGTSGGQGCIDVDPLFTSTSDYHISTGSPCYNTGNPGLSDPDGSRSDMGYFGGPNCPIYPVVYEMTVAPNGNNINVQAKARANY